MYACVGKKGRIKEQMKRTRFQVIPSISFTQVPSPSNHPNYLESPNRGFLFFNIRLVCKPTNLRQDHGEIAFLLVSRPKSALHQLVKRNDRIAHRRPLIDVVDRSSAAPLRPTVTIMSAIIVVRVLRSSAPSTFVRSMARVAGSWVVVVDWQGWARVAAVADSDNWLRILLRWWRSVYGSGLWHWEWRR